MKVYKTLFHHNDVIIEPYGIIHQNNDTIIIDQNMIRMVTSKRRKNLMRIQLNATLVVTNNDTLNHLEDYRHKHIDTISKVNYKLTNYLIESLNSTINYEFVKSWGYMDPITHIWNGMVGNLVNNNYSNIGASALFFTTDRIKYIDYIAMPSPTRSKFVFRSPKLSYTDNVYILPFDKDVWGSLFTLIIVNTLTLGFVTKIEWKILFNTPKRESIIENNLMRPSYLESLNLVIGAACQQGSPVSPISLTARTIVMITFTSLMFLYTSYSANIVALLQSPSNKIRTLEDLLNSRLKFGVDDTVFNKYYFSQETESIRRKIYEQKIIQKDGTKNFMPLDKGIEKLREGLFAFHMELGVGYKLVSETFYENEKCELHEIQYLQVIDPWYAIKKNSSYKEILKIGLMLLHEYGIQDRENSKLYTKKPKCVSDNGNFVTATLIDTRSAILLLLYGYILSFTIIFIEIIISKNKFIYK